MTEREKWEAGLWYDANYTPELCAEREKAEELYTEFNQTRPSEEAKRAELLRQLLPHMEDHVVILPHLYVDYGYHCFIGAGTYINHGAYPVSYTHLPCSQAAGRGRRAPDAAAAEVGDVEGLGALVQRKAGRSGNAAHQDVYKRQV